MNHHRRTRSRPGGWLLIEMLVVLSLLGLFLLLASRLFIGIARIERDTRHNQMMVTRFDSMLWRLRRDVWHATAIDAPGNAALNLTLSTGERVMWAFDEAVTREGSDGSRNWTKLPPAMAFTVAPGRVILTAGSDAADDHRARFTLVSLPMALEAAP